VIAPNGLGFWTAFESTVDAGNKARDLQVTIDRCHAAGVTWIAPRAGAGAANDVSFNEQSLAAYLAGGLRVYPWVFPYPGSEPRVVAAAKRYFLAGAHGFIINAEFEYQPASAASARAMVAGIRQAWHDAQGERRMRGLDPIADEAFVAHAPPDYLGAGIGHALSDELVALDDVCDAIMPQVYAWEHSDHGHAFHTERVMAGYAKRGLGPDRVWPVACTYRPKQRGGKPTPPMLNEGKRVGEDIAEFLNLSIVKACPAPSLYSLDAITWINGKDDHVMRVLSERHAARAADTDPAPPITEPETPTGKSSPRWRAVTPENEPAFLADFLGTLVDPDPKDVA
jgi:hypothetical protein